MNKIMSYVNDITNIIKDFFPDEDPELIKTLVTEEVKERENREFNRPTFLIEYPKGKTVTDISLRKIEKLLDKEKPIITKYGTCFYRHDEKESILASMLAYEGKERKVVKKEAFKHINDEDPTEYVRLDNIQKTIKILMNSFYGVLNAMGSIFYSPDCAASITYCGENIIMTAITCFERFLTNNIKFYSYSDMISYCKNIIEEEYTNADCYDVSFDIDFSVDAVYEYLMEHFYEHNQTKAISTDEPKSTSIYKYLSIISERENGQELLNRIVYKNNLKNFILHAYVGEDKLLDYFESIFNTEFLDPNEPNEEQKETLDAMREIILDYVFYDYQNFFKNEECKKGERRTVLTVDTDSTFLYLGSYYYYFKDNCSNVTDEKECIITVINTMTYFLTGVINKAYETMTGSSNIPEDKRSLINMKNEFLIRRIMLTKNKKNYAYSCLMREGNLIEHPKLEIKGLPIKKVSTNKYIREYFTELLNNDIIQADEINYPKIIGKYFDLTDMIESSISKGETKYTVPVKVNEADSYEDPFSIKGFRGAAIWNILYPELEISFPSKLNMMNLIMVDDFDVVSKTIKDYIEPLLEEPSISDEFAKEYEIFMERLQEIYNEPRYFKSGIINSICLPKNIKEFPVFLRPFIDKDKMILDNINSGTLILDALDINTPKIADNIVPTNYIKF